MLKVSGDTPIEISDTEEDPIDSLITKEEENKDIKPFDKEEEINLLRRIDSRNIQLIRDSVELKLSRININYSNEKYKGDEYNESLIAMRSVILSIAQRLETQEKFNELVKAMDELVESKPQELETTTSSFIRNVLGENSKTCNLLRFIHQNIIFACVWQLKKSVTRDVMTGDVQGPSGWQIVVLFANDIISVSHRRREKSLGLPPEKSFWFEWILHMTINRDVTKLISCNLRVCDLRISDTADEATKEKWRRLFCNGDLMIC